MAKENWVSYAKKGLIFILGNIIMSFVLSIVLGILGSGTLLALAANPSAGLATGGIFLIITLGIVLIAEGWLVMKVAKMD